MFFLLLTKKSQKLISLFDLLIAEDRWFRIAEISDYLDLAIRSTQRYINELFDVIQDYNARYNDDIELLMTKNKGVKLVVKNEMSSFGGFIRYITINDKIFELSRAIFFGQFKNPTQFAYKYGLSMTQVASYLKRCNEFCVLSGLSLSNTTYEVLGDEKKIRVITYSITWFLNHGNFWPDSLSEIEESKLSAMIDQLTKKYGFEIIPTKKRKLTYFIATSLLRIRKKKYVSMQEEWLTFFEEDSSDIVEMIKELCQNYHVYNTAEIYFLSVYWQSETTIYAHYDPSSDILALHKKKQSVIYQVTIEFYKLFTATIIDIPKKMQEECFKHAFFTHLNCFISKINDYFNFDTVFLQEDTTIFPSLKNRLLTLIDTLYTKTHSDIFLNKEVLLRAYMLIYSSVKSLSEYEPAISVYLETDLPSTEESYIKNYILDYFQSVFNLVFIDHQTSKEADVILSSISLAEEANHCSIKLSSDLKKPISHRSMKALEKKLIAINECKLNQVSQHAAI